MADNTAPAASGTMVGLKYLFVGLWACAVSLISTYSVMYWKAQQQYTAAHPIAIAPKLQQIKTKVIVVPRMVNGSIDGHVLAQFTFTIDASVANVLQVTPDLYLVDESFRMIYSGDVVDFRTLRTRDLAILCRALKDAVNQRVGVNLVKEARASEVSYLPKMQFRGGTAIGK